MATARVAWLQVEAAPTARLSWLQIDGGPATGPAARVSFLQIDANPPLIAAAPSNVAGAATGGTTATLTLTDNSGGLASHRWQLREVVSGAWADAVGATNPSPPGVTSFNAAGLGASGEYEVRAQSDRHGLVQSAYVQGASTFWTDNTSGGGAEIPDLTSTLAIGATLGSFLAALAMDGPLGYRGDSLTASGVSGNCLLPLVTLPADNAVLFRAELVSSSFPANTLIVYTDGRYVVDPGTPNGSYSFTFRWYRAGVAQTPLVTQNVQIGPSGGLSVAATLGDFTAALAFSVPLLPTLAINATLDPFASAVSFGTVPSLSIFAVMGDFTSIIPLVGEISGTLPETLSTARQYKVNPDTHLDAYAIQQGYALTWAKDPQSRLDYSIDWADWLADVPGDALANMYVTASAGLSVPVQGIRGAVTAIMAGGGVLNQRETAVVRVATAFGRIDERTITLLIQDR